MHLLDFYIKSNYMLRCLDSVEALVIEHTGLLSRLFNCPVSIVLKGREAAFGQPCSTHILKEPHPVMSTFTWQNGIAYEITDGVIVFWARSLPDNVLGANAVSQTDIAIRNVVMRYELQVLASTDGLTGLLNRRTFMERFNNELKHIRSLGMMIIDLDHFKLYNDSFGHPAGDELLKTTGELIKGKIRSTDLAGRCGGEEFGIIVTDCNRLGLLAVAEKIRKSIETLPAKRAISCSIGGCVFPDEGISVDELYRLADERLYRAKEGGRNCVVV